MNCQHRWIPRNFGEKYRTPNHYLYQCARCGAISSAILKTQEKKSDRTD